MKESDADADSDDDGYRLMAIVLTSKLGDGGDADVMLMVVSIGYPSRLCLL